MSENSEREPKDESSDADTKKTEGQEPSLQEHHDPGTDADSASGGAAD